MKFELVEVMRGALGFAIYGSQPVIEFLESLTGEEDERVTALLERVSEHGVPKQPTKSGFIDVGLFELKSFQVRLGFVYDSSRRRTILLIHAFRKKTDRWPNHEVTTAKRSQAKVYETIREGSVQYGE